MSKKHGKKTGRGQGLGQQGQGQDQIWVRGKPVPPPLSAPEALSSRGKRVIAAGVALLSAGFIVLSLADPMGRNWAANLAPFLILGGYALVGGGIFLPEAVQPSTPNPGEDR